MTLAAWALRLLGALAMWALGALLVWVALMVLCSPVNDSHWLAVAALKGFALLVMGTIGLGLIGLGVSILVPSLAQRRVGASAALRALCPGCGRSLHDDSGCASCAIPELPPTQGWGPHRQESSLMTGGLIALMGGIACLGLFMLVQGLTEPGLWWLARTGYALLGLMMILVGAFAIWGSWLGRHGATTAAPDATYHAGWSQPPAWVNIRAEFFLARGKLVRASGTRTTTSQLRPGGTSERPDLAPAQRAFLLQLSRLQGAGAIWLSHQRTLSWKRRKPALAGHADGAYRDLPSQDELTHEETSALLLHHGDEDELDESGVERIHRLDSTEPERDERDELARLGLLLNAPASSLETLFHELARPDAPQLAWGELRPEFDALARDLLSVPAPTRLDPLASSLAEALLPRG